MSNLISLLAIGELRGVGPAKLRKLLQDRGAPPPALAQLHGWLSESGLPDSIGGRTDELQSAWKSAEAYYASSREHGIELVPWWSQDYPAALKAIRNAPPYLWTRGKSPVLNAPAVAIVGTRRPSTWGLSVARRLGQLFPKEGVVVVSGLALGIDAEVHRGVVSARGKAVAVMAHGLDDVRPAENRGLATDLLGLGGALVSEHRVGVPPLPRYFVERNRIQVGLSEAVVVVETRRTGGTMHTVAFCAEADRILAVAGFDLDAADPLTEDARSGNRMLLQGPATIPVSGKDDVIRLAAMVRDRHAARGRDAKAEPNDRDDS